MADCGRCFKCREGTGCIRAVGFAPSSMPNRHPGVTEQVATDKRWDRDMPAYKRIRANGVQPPRIDDCAALEGHANDQFEVEMGKLIPDRVKPQVKEGLAISRELQVGRPKSVQVPSE